MNVLTAVLALLAALANGAASVLQRRAAVEQVNQETADGRPGRAGLCAGWFNC
ncbi:hypothetical protein NKH18_03760 [Streptomyces sp. M10(2022)]